MPTVVNVAKKGGLKSAPVKQENLALARDEAPELPYVNWRTDPGLRKLYFYCIIICVASATTGYDGYVDPCTTNVVTTVERNTDESAQIYVEQPSYNAALGEILQQSCRLKPRDLDRSLQYW